VTLAGWLRRWPSLYLAARELRYPGGREPLDAETRRLLSSIMEDGDIRVLAGPFAGMLYLSASGSGLLPRIVGSYELELHDTIALTLRRGYELVVNVGSGEGYYAVGYARSLPEARVVAFDQDPIARRRLQRLAALNGVADRTEIRALCRGADLRRVLDAPSRALVVCDCEGGELELLDPLGVPGLLHADVLVELHDFIDPSISATILLRFEKTHAVTVIPAEARDGIMLPPLSRLRDDERRRATWEGRPDGMQWAWLEARRTS
jgi:hypothetical protein